MLFENISDSTFCKAFFFLADIWGDYPPALAMTISPPGGGWPGSAAVIGTTSELTEDKTMIENLELWFRQIEGISSLVSLVERQPKLEPGIQNALYAIMCHLDLLSSEMEEIMLSMKREEEMKAE